MQTLQKKSQKWYRAEFLLGFLLIWSAMFHRLRLVRVSSISFTHYFQETNKLFKYKYCFLIVSVISLLTQYLVIGAKIPDNVKASLFNSSNLLKHLRVKHEIPTTSACLRSANNKPIMQSCSTFRCQHGSSTCQAQDKRRGKAKMTQRSKGGRVNVWEPCIVTAWHLNECLFLGMLAPALKHENEHRV